MVVGHGVPLAPTSTLHPTLPFAMLQKDHLLTKSGPFDHKHRSRCIRVFTVKDTEGIHLLPLHIFSTVRMFYTCYYCFW